MATTPRPDGAIKLLEPDGVNVFAARYVPDPGIFKGNPFCEALDPTPPLDEYEALYSNFPPTPTAAVRRLPVEQRRQQLLGLAEVVVYFPEWKDLAQTLDDMVRFAYLWRNVATPEGKLALYGRHRHPDQIPKYKRGAIPSQGKGLLLMAITGMGKTTFLNMYLHRYPKVLVHDIPAFRGHQIPVVRLSVPHDGTVAALCAQFFKVIDELVGTNFQAEASALRTIAKQVLKMQDVARTYNVGLLAIDEVQNLRNGNPEYAKRVLSLFSEIIEVVGISLLAIATPALIPVLKTVRDVRKMGSIGTKRIAPMTLKGGQWDLFCEVYWEYTYLEKKVKLTPKIKKVWFELSGGNSSFAALLFYFAQRDELGEQEYLDEDSFRRAFKNNMEFLAPAVSALLSNDRAKQEEIFDDLYDRDAWKEAKSILSRAQDDDERSLPRSSDEDDDHSMFDDEFDEDHEDDEAAAPKSAKIPTSAKKAGAPAKKGAASGAKPKTTGTNKVASKTAAKPKESAAKKSAAKKSAAKKSRDPAVGPQVSKPIDLPTVDALSDV